MSLFYCSVAFDSLLKMDSGTVLGGQRGIAADSTTLTFRTVFYVSATKTKYKRKEQGSLEGPQEASEIAVVLSFLTPRLRSHLEWVSSEASRGSTIAGEEGGIRQKHELFIVQVALL